MAALLTVGLCLGIEKMERKISERRLEKKEKKAIAVCHITITQSS